MGGSHLGWLGLGMRSIRSLTFGGTSPPSIQDGVQSENPIQDPSGFSSQGDQYYL